MAVHRPELLDALEAAPQTRLSVAAWRHMFGRTPPDRENTAGARWNPPGVAALYLSCTRDGAIAEGDHAIAVQPLRPKARRRIYEVRLTLQKVVDLRAASDFAATGLTQADLGDDDHARCQELGAAIDWMGYDGLLVASARSDADNLVIYPAQASASARFDYDSGEAYEPETKGYS